MIVKAIYISPGHDFFGRHGKERLRHGVQSVSSVECVARRGLVGDRFFDHKNDYKGQITFLNWSVYIRMRDDFDLPDLDPWVFRRNVLIEGINLNHLVGKTFELQGIQFEGVEECRPCYWMDKAVTAGVHEALEGQGGLRAKILTDGFLKVDNR